jgi:1-deoxy-D-xylulose-5-phosphate reductoisomerase
VTTNVECLDLTKVCKLEFYKPDTNKFRALTLAYRALEEGGVASIVMNAANEVVVAAFLNDKIKFLQITEVVEKVMQKNIKGKTDSIESIIAVDKETRMITEEVLKCLSA